MEEHNDISNNTPSVLAITPAVIGWGVASVVLSILMITFNHSAMVLGAGFFMKFLAFIAGAVMGLVGALIGDAIRRFAQPDAVYTTGGALHLIWLKLFWLLGPQVIGLILGIALGSSLVLR
ncbi:MULTISPECIES: hypothetical protein [unclassified Pseudomonas]|uniref:hypothetical protein n=1 Tax=unclassified Pseudomonas TaxID=196821 RepID=UPI00244A3A67|nr:MULTISPECIES: hypothetical protein [unclassified Pseudomonas]MDH0897617.1 hypothetical protein [Pseudomonas sp. GD03875]MDH1067680.1 hypothetical protein [Pseudomonas sp. GD03985]